MSTHSVLVTGKLDSLFAFGGRWAHIELGAPVSLTFQNIWAYWTYRKPDFFSRRTVRYIPVVLTPSFCYETYFSWKTTYIYIYYSTHCNILKVFLILPSWSDTWPSQATLSRILVARSHLHQGREKQCGGKFSLLFVCLLLFFLCISQVFPRTINPFDKQFNNCLWC